MFGRYYSLGGAGSVTTPTGTVPLPQQAGQGYYTEQYGTRVPEYARENVALNYTVIYNIQMQTITILDEGAARWGEEIALEIEFDNLDTPPTPNNPPSNPPSTPNNPPRNTQLRLPIGGTVWEDTIKDTKKHTGYNNLLDKVVKKVSLGLE